MEKPLNEETQELFDFFTNSKDNSDLHIKEGFVPYFRKNGELIDKPLTTTPNGIVTQDAARAILEDIFFSRFKEKFADKCEEFLSSGYQEDFAIQINNSVRARVNVYKSLGKINIALRQIPSIMPNINDIGFMPVHLNLIKNFIQKREGLILITGQTGSGKSTTLASLLNEINETVRKHIITIEDPVEFKHTNKKSIIAHREVGEGNDTETFFTGLRAALREDPDIILVGEMRDAETSLAAIQAAQTGHIVLATLHTNSAAETITRLIDMFPPEKASGIAASIAQSLLMIISQKLVPNTAGRRVLAYEVLYNNSVIKNLLVNDINVIDVKIRDQLKSSYNEGMIGLPRFLSEKVKENVINKNVAIEYLGGVDAQIKEFESYLVARSTIDL